MTALPLAASLLPDRADTVVAGIERLSAIGRMCWTRGWSLGTSSNYSTVVGDAPYRLLITASGYDKGRLTPDNFVVVDAQGQAIDPRLPKPSAETLLHTTATNLTEAKAVVHTHSVWSTLLSDALFAEGRIGFSGLEMLKGLAGVTTHQSSVGLAIFDNTQDMPDLARRVGERLIARDPDLRWGFLLRGHGLYTWGATLDEAVRHLEVIEFLLEVLGRQRMLNAGGTR